MPLYEDVELQLRCESDENEKAKNEGGGKELELAADSLTGLRLAWHVATQSASQTLIAPCNSRWNVFRSSRSQSLRRNSSPRPAVHITYD